jgi:hypothetical protein
MKKILFLLSVLLFAFSANSQVYDEVQDSIIAYPDDSIKSVTKGGLLHVIDRAIAGLRDTSYTRDSELSDSIITNIANISTNSALIGMNAGRIDEISDSLRNINVDLDSVYIADASNFGTILSTKTGRYTIILTESAVKLPFSVNVAAIEINIISSTGYFEMGGFSGLTYSGYKPKIYIHAPCKISFQGTFSNNCDIYVDYIYSDSNLGIDFSGTGNFYYSSKYNIDDTGMTQSYWSSAPQGSGSGDAISLNSTPISQLSPSDNYILKYNALEDSLKWEVDGGAGGSGVVETISSTNADITVNSTDPANPTMTFTNNSGFQTSADVNNSISSAIGTTIQPYNLNTVVDEYYTNSLDSISYLYSRDKEQSDSIVTNISNISANTSRISEVSDSVIASYSRIKEISDTIVNYLDTVTVGGGGTPLEPRIAPTIVSGNAGLGGHGIEINWDMPAGDLAFYDTLRVCYVGSSTMYGEATVAEPYIPSAVLDGLGDNLSRNFFSVNVALSGARTYTAMPSFFPTWSSYPPNLDHNIDVCIDSSANFIVIQFPSNDINGSIPVDSSIRNMRVIRDYAESKGCEVICVSPQGWDEADNTKRVAMLLYKQKLSDLFTDRFVDIWMHTTHNEDGNFNTKVGLDPQYDGGDGTHMNIVGNGLMGKMFSDMLMRIAREKCDISRIYVERSVNGGEFEYLMSYEPSRQSFVDYSTNFTDMYQYRLYAKYKDLRVSDYSDTLTISLAPDSSPLYVSSEIGAIADNVCEITFNTNVNVTGVSQISFNASGGALTATSVISGANTNTPTVMLSRELLNNETVTITISAGSEIVNAVSSEPFDGMTAQSVTNNVPAPPTYVSSEIGTIEDSVITVTFESSVDATDATGVTASTDSAVSITIQGLISGSGTTTLSFNLNRVVTHTEVITLTIGGTNTITSAVGGISFAGITDESVTNNVTTVPPVAGRQVVQCNIGDETEPVQFWNILDNWSIVPNPNWTNLIDSTGQPTTVSIENLFDGTDPTISSGRTTGDNSWIYPDSVMENYIFESDADLSDTGYWKVRVYGLEANQAYTIKCFGSRSGVSGSRITRYAVGGADLTVGTEVDFADLETVVNDSEFATIYATSSGTGELYIGFRNTNDQYCYWNFFTITNE